MTILVGLAERDSQHPCGADQFVSIETLNTCRSALVLAPRRNIDPARAQTARDARRRTHVKQVILDYVVLNF